MCRWLAAAGALVALLIAAVFAWDIGRTRCALSTPSAPRAMVSLQLVRSVTDAAAILRGWNETPPCPGECTAYCGQSRIDTARANLGYDDRFILSYGATLVLAVLAVFPGILRWRWIWAVLVAAVVAGLCDAAENWCIERLLSRSLTDDLMAYAPYVSALRVFAQTKFILLLAVGLALTAGLLARLRRCWIGTPDALPEPRDFFALAVDEANGILAERRRSDVSIRDEERSRLLERERLDVRENEPDGTPEEAAKSIEGNAKPDDEQVAVAKDGAQLVVGPASSDEPWIRFRSHDIVGLALSGGGIRSATFNLGLIAGLNHLNLLSRIDYLTTVSGGGYVGSFWSAWLKRDRDKPVPPGTNRPQWPSNSGMESAPVRHLREFSRFLAARRGFFEAEMWQAVVAVLAGVLVSFLTASSVIGLALVFWLGANFFLACPERWAGALTVLVLTGAVTRVFRQGWAKGSAADERDLAVSVRIDWWTTVASVAFAVFIETCWIHSLPRRVWSSPDGGPGWTSPVGPSYAGWWQLTGIERLHPNDWFWSPRLYDLALVWGAVGLAQLACRAGLTAYARGKRAARVWIPGYDRVVMRFLGSAVGWAAIATLWHVSVNLGPASKSMATLSVLSGGGFVALRNWIGVSLRSGTQASALGRLKPLLPVLLAYLTVALLIGGVGTVLIALGGTDWLGWYGLTAVMGLIVVLMLVLDPAEIGLHSFYRDRIVRAYSGASNPDSKDNAVENRQTNRRRDDDLLLEELLERPLHVVCCAANDLSGDPIGNLGRGARSAALSRHGVAVADGWRDPGRLSLGGAVTASAAAFNSNMGSISMSVGPVVSFLMAALSLRLGLWVPNPRRKEASVQRWLPGVLFFREMFALTIADDAQAEIHLSDGAHFENLALYELVRRHCRYVIVSDCGEDPTVAFDDFGNAARRIREDFGVDIDIDLSPLRPVDRRSRQHAVVGTIHYTDFDKGVLVYVKPTLTGDEPPDVLQHATRNEQFPHEPTVDQFYDEAQWESYRELGKHTACTVFGFVDRHPGTAVPTADWVFTSVVQEWYPAPPELPRLVLVMTERFGLMESELQRQGAIAMLHEVFPEIDALCPQRTGAPPVTQGAGARSDTEHAANLACMLRVLQLMQEVWASCQLDEFWNHPLNLGWINSFARWTAAATFRMWWPLLRPMYSPGFQRFLHERYPILVHDGSPEGRVTGPFVDMPAGLAAEWWQHRYSPEPPPVTEQTRVYGYEIDLRSAGGVGTTSVQVAIMLIHRATDGTAWWTSEDFFVPPSLWGAGLGGAFLRHLLKELRDPPTYSCLDVYVKAPVARNDPGSWSDRLSYVAFYERQGFRIVEEVDRVPDGTECRAVHLRL